MSILCHHVREMLGAIICALKSYTGGVVLPLSARICTSPHPYICFATRPHRHETEDCFLLSVGGADVHESLVPVRPERTDPSSAKICS